MALVVARRGRERLFSRYRAVQAHQGTTGGSRGGGRGLAQRATERIDRSAALDSGKAARLKAATQFFLRHSMKINGNEIRPGNVIEHKGGLWIAVKTQAVKPGKGPAYAQVELKNVIDGPKLNERFRSSETVERKRSLSLVPSITFFSS